VTTVNLIETELKDVLSVDARTAGQLGIPRRNAIRLRRSTDHNLISNWIADMTNM
jgi:hypothetical protein